MGIRLLESSDREKIRSIVTAVGNFNPTEIEIAMELVDESLADPESGYFVYVLQNDGGEICGYVCFGPTPLTDHAFDFYWLAVDPKWQGKGYGSELIRFVEREVRDRGGKLLVLETSSLESYRRTVQVYRRLGYEQSAQIKDFYRPGDDKLIFVKRF